MSRRSRARIVALQVLYQQDLNPEQDSIVSEEFLSRRLDSKKLQAFASSLVEGVSRHRAELDRLLESTADHWSLERMAATDRNVMRLGAFEILMADTPDAVAINEAVELAKRFGSGQSAQFVNGILDRLLKQNRQQDQNQEAENQEN